MTLSSNDEFFSIHTNSTNSNSNPPHPTLQSQQLLSHQLFPHSSRPTPPHLSLPFPPSLPSRRVHPGSRTRPAMPPYGLIHSGNQTQDEIDPQQGSGAGGPQAASGSGGPQIQDSATRVVRGEELDHVSAEVARMQRSIDRMMTLMENSAIFQPTPPAHVPPPALQENTHPFVPPQFQSHTQNPTTNPFQRPGFPPAQPQQPPNFQEQGPRPQPAPVFVDQPFQEEEQTAQLEPQRLKDVFFSGEPGHLLLFLRTIRDFLRNNRSGFSSEKRRVVWISRHFGFHPSDRKKTPSPAENWYSSLVIDNARRQGIIDVYGDLDGQPFILPTLSSVSAFLEGMITVFGDKFMRENAKRALEACKQRNLTIGEYNSQFKSLVYLVEDVEATRIEKYTAGLNPRIIRKAMSKQWTDAATLDEKMELASDAAAQLDLLALLPPDPPMSNHPLSSARVTHPPPPPPRPQQDPDAMEIDAVRAVTATAGRSILDAARAICRARNLCFRCLAPIVPGVHTGSLNCPNPFLTPAQRQDFVERCRQNPNATPTPVSSIRTLSPSSSSFLTYQPAPPPSPLATHQRMPSVSVDSHPPAAVPGSSPHPGYDEHYEDYDEEECATVEVPLATVQVRLEGSKGSRLLVPASFRGPGGALIPATILVDTGAMANFVNKSFVRQHDLKIRPRNTPIRCVGFDGREGVGGLVTQDWAGMIQLSSVDAKPFTLQSSFGITRLGSVDTIFGLPWLDRQGWVASGSLNGGHQFTLGSTPLYVIESASMGGKPGDELYTPSP
ncbi:hypothetical protein PGT21_004710 [Puccinia graminis f. sp. tritici]|uniref:Retrotransposon gag domain-containing protein n=1 Tax=Puccinia graminis f. sp. tritici TaxID=56615 RepID=A0A5B0SJ45_PUCGR|nr:hypothetical protein PGT21_004710 [Puccinia graminis f. sp. tritici]KAA1137800.1 hypothetical protein PGTUg99_020060 [Puccinia graminis f. sp. tritici]